MGSKHTLTLLHIFKGAGTPQPSMTYASGCNRPFVGCQCCVGRSVRLRVERDRKRHRSSQSGPDADAVDACAVPQHAARGPSSTEALQLRDASSTGRRHRAARTCPAVVVRHQILALVGSRRPGNGHWSVAGR